MKGENGVPETPDWCFIPGEVQEPASLVMPALWQGDQA